MTHTQSLPSCPYKGLQTYTEADQAYFFGRERDQQIIISNLYAAPLTILYGASGVGKSSILLAGVAPELRATPRVALIVFRDWQDEQFDRTLKQAVLNEIARTIGKETSVDLNLPFDEFLAQCLRALRGDIFFILDQFEEYFLYHTASSDEGSFDAQFARAVNRQEIRANFLLSIREDGLSKLDRFQGRIPNLLANMLRLEHLDRQAARSAIEKPISQFNQFQSTNQPVEIEPLLVDEILSQVETGKISLSETGQGVIKTKSSEAQIETPYLQLVMTRLWDEEITADKRKLRLDTLKALGNAKRILETHLDTSMSALPPDQQEVAARVFHYLVTPSGSKIAHSVPDLAEYANLRQPQLAPVMERLSRGDIRILRAVPPPLGQPKVLRYEIFHDVLAAAILDWRKRWERNAEAQRLAAEAQRLARARVNEAMARLNQAEQIVAAQLFPHFITPSGVRVRLTPSALANRAKIPFGQVRHILSLLGRPKAEVLVLFHTPDDSLAEPSYELFSDLLVTPLMDWQKEFLEGTVYRSKYAWPLGERGIDLIGNYLDLLFLGLLSSLFYCWMRYTRCAFASHDRDVLLFYGVMSAGALGGAIAVLRSIPHRIGGHLIPRVQVVNFIAMPAVGAVLGTIIQLLLRNLVVSASPGAGVNFFGVVTISFMVGIYVNQFYQRLNEIFTTIFTPPIDKTKS